MKKGKKLILQMMCLMLFVGTVITATAQSVFALTFKGALESDTSTTLTPGGSGDDPVDVLGSGWRISLCQTGFDLSEDNDYKRDRDGSSGKGTIFTDPKIYRRMDVAGAYSVYVTDYEGGFQSVYYKNNACTVVAKNAVVCSDIGSLFSSLQSSSSKLNNSPVVKDASGNVFFNGSVDSFWLKDFANAVSKNKEAMMLELLSKFGFDDLNCTDNYCFVVEPVVIYYFTHKNKTVALGWLDYCKRMSSFPDKYCGIASDLWECVASFAIGNSPGMFNYLSDNKNIEYVRKSEWSPYAIASARVAPNTGANSIIPWNVAPDWAYEQGQKYGNAKAWEQTGYMVFGAEDEMVSGDPVKTSVNYTLVLKNPLNGDKTVSLVTKKNNSWDLSDKLEVCRSLLLMQSGSKGSVKKNLTKLQNVAKTSDATSVDRDAKKIKLISDGTGIKSEDNKKKVFKKPYEVGDNVLKRFTGVSEKAEKKYIDSNKYIPVTATAGKIKYKQTKDNETQKIENILMSNAVLNGTKLEAQAVDLSGGKNTVGFKYQYDLKGVAVDDEVDQEGSTAMTEKIASNLSKLISTKDTNVGSDDTSVKFNNRTDNAGTLYKSTKPARYVVNGGKDMTAKKIKSVITNYSMTALSNASAVDKMSYTKYTVAEDDKAELGLSVTLLVPKTEISSTMGCAIYDNTTKTYEKLDNRSVKYLVTDSGVLEAPKLKYNSYYVIWEKDGKKNGSHDISDSTSADFCKYLAKKGTKITSADELKKEYEAYDNKVRIKSRGKATTKEEFRFGSQKDKYQGYNMLVLQVKTSKPPTPPKPEDTSGKGAKGDLQLRDYELNYVFPSMLKNSSDIATLTNEISYWKTGKESLGVDCNQVSDSVVASSSANKKVKTASVYNNNKNNLIAFNNGLGGTNKNILKYKGTNFDTESRIRSGVVFKNNISSVKLSWAVDLTRNLFGDNLVESSIATDQTISDDFREKNLGMSKGNKPNTPASAKVKRDSNATVGNIVTDTYAWNVFFQTGSDSDKDYGSTEATKEVLHVKDECQGHWQTDEAGNQNASYCPPTTWKSLSSMKIYGSTFGTDPVTYTVYSSADKYQTDVLPTGKVTNHQVKDALKNPTEKVTVDGKEEPKCYGSIVSVSADTVAKLTGKTIPDLGFYPEVEMRAYETSGASIGEIETSTGYSRTASGDLTPHQVWVMGEVKRTVQPSVMMITRVVDKELDTTVTGNKYSETIKGYPTGKLKSDSVAVGTNASAKAGKKPVIYAGGDITMKVTPNFGLKMYGYALDLVEEADTDVVTVADKKVKADWGNNYKAQETVEGYVKDTLENKLKFDVTLKVKGYSGGKEKTYRNFNTTFGGFGKVTSNPDGVFSIRVDNGSIVEDDNYTKLMTQIATDYGVTLDKAKEYFNGSDIAKSIADAVEDRGDDFNESLGAKKAIKGKGADNHWYNETARTFVIRRYDIGEKKKSTSTSKYYQAPISVDRLLVEDKIDYGAAPTSKTSSDSDFNTGTGKQTSYKTVEASWYLTMYLDKDTLGYEGNAVYNPKAKKTSDATTSLNKAVADGTVLIPEMQIKKADFVIPSASTSNMKKH